MWVRICRPTLLSPILKKKYHGRELTDEDKNFNTTYAILSGVYRGAIARFHKATKIVQVVPALCNLNLNKHYIRR